ncbi:MAG: DUF2017 family protein [Actinobacteria bacterium]|nr:DUF2017 family protein [Actinomycetota bacterium]
MKVRRRGGRVTVRLQGVEAATLGNLLDQLALLVEADADHEDPVIRRLYPSAYPDDADAEREFRGLTLDSLRVERRERVEACQADLAGGRELELDADSGRRWIQVLNDLRLALGTELGVTEEDEPALDPTDPERDRRLVYYWLTGLQDELVRALMG